MIHNQSPSGRWAAAGGMVEYLSKIELVREKLSFLGQFSFALCELLGDCWLSFRLELDFR